MMSRNGREASGRNRQAGRGVSRTKLRLRLESLEGRELLTAALAPIADITSPAGLGYQVPLNGSASNLVQQDYTVTSSNPRIKATIAQGKFLIVNVSHTSSGANDPAFSGSITFQLFDDLTPITASRIEQLANSGFYDGKNFHRISAGFPDAQGFIAQGGSVSGTGLDQPPAPGQPGGLPTTGFPFIDEYNLQLVYNGSGQLAMANAGNDTNTSQFFITSSTPRFLDFNKTIFGQVVAGMDIYNKIIAVPVGGSDGTTPKSPITINFATTSTINPNGVVHVDTTGAAQGETSTITVTAADTGSNTIDQKPFKVTVGPTNASPPSDPNSNSRPFISSFPSSVTVGLNQKAVFKIGATTAQPKTDILSFIVGGGVNASGTGFTPVANATASIDSNGVVTVTPNTGFSGTISVLVGVRNQIDHTGGSGVTNPGNFDTHVIPVTVNASATPIGLPPITIPFTTTALTNTTTSIQLQGQSGNPGTSQTITYQVLQQPQHGTISGLNPTTGKLNYIPNGNFAGTDTFTYNVTSNGAPTPNFASNTSTVTINVALGMTNAVRMINRVLVITAPPRFDKHGDQITVALVGNTIQTTVNGVVDSLQPATTAVDSIVVYGSKQGDNLIVRQEVARPVLIDGGHGHGVNYLTAGGGAARLHAWFGQNVVQAGVSTNDIVGRLGKVKVKKGLGATSVFLSPINPANHPHYGTPPHGGKPVVAGSFYKFSGNSLVKTKQPVTIKVPQAPNR